MLSKSKGVKDAQLREILCWFCVSQLEDFSSTPGVFIAYNVVSNYFSSSSLSVIHRKRQTQSYAKETWSLKSFHPWISNLWWGGRNDAIVWNQVLTSSSMCQQGGVPNSTTKLLRHHKNGLSARSVRCVLGKSAVTMLFLLSRCTSSAKWKITDWLSWLLNDWYKAGLH